MAHEMEQQLTMSTIGFIGLGNMGFGMAMNVRKNLPSTSKLFVCELDRSRRDDFIRQASEIGQVEQVETPRDLSEQCVCQ